MLCAALHATMCVHHDLPLSIRCVGCCQASFEPPGLTVAVKRDRAVEALMTVGNSFNVNILAEGREKVGSARVCPRRLRLCSCSVLLEG